MTCCSLQGPGTVVEAASLAHSNAQQAVQEMDRQKANRQTLAAAAAQQLPYGSPAPQPNPTVPLRAEGDALGQLLAGPSASGQLPGAALLLGRIAEHVASATRSALDAAYARNAQLHHMQRLPKVCIGRFSGGMVAPEVHIASL